MNFAEIKTLIESQGDGLEAFKGHIEQRLSAIEGKQNRLRLGGFIGEAKGGNDAEAKAEFSGFVRKGIVPMDKKALSTATDADGGYAVPMEIDSAIESLLLEISPMRQLARVVPASTSDFKTLVNKRGTASGWVGEEDARAETGTPDLAEVAYPSGEIYAFPMATQRSLEDKAFDAEAWLQAEIADEFALKEGAAFVSGIIGKARSQHWRIRKREDLEVFTIAVGRYWLKPYCRHCEGRGVQVEGQIAKDICPVCAGTGRRELPTPAEAGMADLIDERRFQKYVREALLCLDAHITGYLGKTRSALG